MKSPVELTKNLKQLCNFVLLLSIVSGILPVSAQRRRAATGQGNQQVASNQPKKTQACSGAWTGVINYSRAQANSNNKTVPRVSGRGEDTTDWQMNYNYKATVAVIESPEKNGSSIGKATISHSMNSTETVVAKEKNSCDRGKTWREMSCTSTSKTETTGNASGLKANVNVGLNMDGSYTVSV